MAPGCSGWMKPFQSSSHKTKSSFWTKGYVRLWKSTKIGENPSVIRVHIPLANKEHLSCFFTRQWQTVPFVRLCNGTNCWKTVKTPKKCPETWPEVVHLSALLSHFHSWAKLTEARETPGDTSHPHYSVQSTGAPSQCHFGNVAIVAWCVLHCRADSRAYQVKPWRLQTVEQEM